MSLTQSILESADLKEESLEVPEWGATILLRGLMCDQLERAREGARKKRDAGIDSAMFGVLLIIESACDPETKKPLFEQAHRDALLKKSAAVIDRVATVILHISGIDAKAKEEAEKN